MRTTVTIDDDVLAVARALAERNGSSLGSALSELARRGFKGMGDFEVVDGIPAFRVDATSRPVTSEDVREALSDWP